MIDPIHLTKYVIRPVLKDLGFYGEPAERLVLGTACKESECGRWLRQLGNGPALGIYQMEPATLKDIQTNYLSFHPKLNQIITSYCGQDTLWEDELVWNLRYATAMCRVHYLRVPEQIPDNLPGQAAFWKCWYNTPLGKGTEEEYISAWRRFIPSDLTTRV